MTDMLRDYIKSYGVPPELEQKARDRFDVKVLEEMEAGLSQRDPKFREKIFDIRKQTLLWAIGQSGKDLDGMLWGRSKLGEAYDKIEDASFQGSGIEPFPELLELKPSEVELGSAAAGTGHVGMDFLGGRGTTVKGGEYLASGGNRKHAHQGQDYAMPEGTAVAVPEQLAGVSMKVSGVGKDPTSGNKLYLSGEFNNHKFDLFMCHFQDGSIQVTNGQTVTAGDMLAKVGNTGDSRGAHLHIETKIDGKRVNPAKFYEHIGWSPQAKPAEKKPEEPPALDKTVLFGIGEPKK